MTTAPHLPAATADHLAPAFSPLYQQIKTLILRSLQAGEWKPGEPIPSEIELAARFRVSQGTMRKAIDELAAENLVVRRQGKGTFVATHAEQHVQYRFLKLVPDSGDIAAEGPAVRTIVDCRRQRATADVARALSLRTGDAVLPDEEQAALLQVNIGTPLLSVERVAHTYHDTPMELRRGLYRTDTHHYRNELG